MNRPIDRNHFFSFSQKLFVMVMALYISFVGCFIAYQYQREKDYKIELLHTQLQNFNLRLHEEVDSNGYTTDKVSQYIKKQAMPDLRITVIDLNGKVLFDNHGPNYTQFKNHLERREVNKAIQKGDGFDVRRTSESTGLPYFYSATSFDDCIMRSALPYSVNLINNLKGDSHYIWFALCLTLLLILIFYQFVKRQATSINRLRKFAMHADRNEPIDLEMQRDFPRNELGEISRHIIQIYKRLHETKEALYIEREKLIAHLQTSHEGLGVFNKNKKEILVNNLFTQYSNLISDASLQTAEEVFAIQELKPITEFINEMQKRPPGNSEKRLSISLCKNGRTFIVECILFQDLSFEISINDITLKEQEVHLKRQLTQNIAHELKTPVSSIQGYLETLVNNKHIAPEKVEIFLERCYAQSNRLSRLLRDISALTRMDEVTSQVDMEPLDIHTLVGAIINETALQLESKQVTVTNALAPKLSIQGNYSLLYSIFRNLMDNAIAYAGSSTQIQINCFREDNSFFYFSFSDNGIGVAPEHLNRLFERFYRVDKGRSRKLGGTGLGLAIVKNAIIMHGGTISAKNNSGGGLEFLFTLSKKPSLLEQG